MARATVLAVTSTPVAFLADGRTVEEEEHP